MQTLAQGVGASLGVRSIAFFCGTNKPWEFISPNVCCILALLRVTVRRRKCNMNECCTVRYCAVIQKKKNRPNECCPRCKSSYPNDAMLSVFPITFCLPYSIGAWLTSKSMKTACSKLRNECRCGSHVLLFALRGPSISTFPL